MGTPITVGQINMNGIAGTTSSVVLSGSAITLTDSTGTDRRGSIERTSNSPTLTINNNLVFDDANGVQFRAFQGIMVNGSISGSSQFLKDGGGVAYLGGANAFTSDVDMRQGTLMATNTAAFSGASAGSYTFSMTGTNTASIGTAVAGTTTFSNALTLNTVSGATGNHIFQSYGTGSTLDITTNSITDGGTAANGAISITRFGGDTQYSITGASGTGTVKFSGTGYTINRNVVGGTSTTVLELAPASGTQTWNGSFTGFSGSASILKTGAGTAILGSGSSAHTYKSQTLVNAGTLILNGTFTQAATTGAGMGSATTGRFQVESGATLGGTGRINVGLANATSANNAVLVKDGGILAPGASIGTLTFDGANFVRTAGNDIILNMASGAKFAFELAGDGTSADRVDFWNYAAGDLLLNTNAIDLTLTGPLVAATYTVDLFRFYSDAGTNLTASSISSGLTLGTLDANISSANIIYGTNSIQLQYTAIPEPGTLVLVGIALGSLLLFRRRHR